jgi:hypothetical protein
VASSLLTELYNPKAFFAHAALLRQAFAHCARFPTAASRRSLGRVSVPVWLIVLSDQLSIVALVSRYLTNKLMLRGPIPKRKPKLPLVQPAWQAAPHPVLASLSERYPGLWGRLPTCYSPVRRSSTPEGAFPLDLHVLSTPPAFVLSQDQTLRDNFEHATRRPRNKRWRELVLSKTRQDMPCCRAVGCRSRRAGRAAMLEPHDGVLFYGPVGTLRCFRRTGVRRPRPETRAEPASTLFSFQRPRATWALG